MNQYLNRTNKRRQNMIIGIEQLKEKLKEKEESQSE